MEWAEKRDLRAWRLVKYLFENGPDPWEEIIR